MKIKEKFRKLVFSKLYFFCLISFIALLSGCTSNGADKFARIAIKQIKPKYNFNSDSTPPAPDYTQTVFWLSLPVNDSLPADVFYIHPTTYFSDQSWNLPLNNQNINKLTKYVIFANQASAFMGIANVYAPYYRQATFYSFLDLDNNGSYALDVAYIDVKAAFDYYLKHYNQGRPFILASHSQGTYLGKKLLKYIDSHADIKQLFITAYLVGWPVDKEYLSELENIGMCKDSTQIGCINSWNTQREFSFKTFANKTTQVTNPLSWENKDVRIEKTENRGAFFISNPRYSFSQKDLFHGRFNIPDDFMDTNDTLIIPNYIGATTKNGVVMVDRPSNQKDLVMLLKAGNYHLYDYNFFYFNIRHNTQTRIHEYLKTQKAHP